jgi:Flp pilus assembly protein TadG
MKKGLRSQHVHRSTGGRRGNAHVRFVLVALVLSLLLSVWPALSDAALHTALVPAALADGPQRGSGG